MHIAAVRTLDRQYIESYKIDPEEWSAMMGDPLGSYELADGTLVQALIGSTGLQFFAAPPDPSAPQAGAHALEVALRAAIDCTLRARSRGAQCEIAPDLAGLGVRGAEMSIKVSHHGRPFVLIMHAEFKPLGEYENCERAFESAGIKCIWLVRSTRQYRLLQSAAYISMVHSGQLDDSVLDAGMAPLPPWLCALPVLPGAAGGPGIEGLAVGVPSKSGREIRLTLPDFVAGVLEGRLCYSKVRWLWR